MRFHAAELMLLLLLPLLLMLLSLLLSLLLEDRSITGKLTTHALLSSDFMTTPSTSRQDAAPS